jgi:hypothetical protein
MPSDDNPGFGRFGTIEGWVGVDNRLLMRWKVNLPRLAGMLTSKPAKPVIEEVLWSLGSLRVPNRTSPVDLWFGRRLAATWSVIREALIRTPSSSLRVVLTSSEANAADPPPKTELVALFAVLKPGSIIIDPTAVAAHLDGRPFATSSSLSRLGNESRRISASPTTTNLPSDAGSRRH